MQNEVIESIFQTVPLGTKVLITDSKQGSEALAIEYGAINHE